MTFERSQRLLLALSVVLIFAGVCVATCAAMYEVFGGGRGGIGEKCRRDGTCVAKLRCVGVGNSNWFTADQEYRCAP